MASDADRKKALDRVRRNIEEHGFHAYVVTGGGIPHYAYTIGLRGSHGAELVLPGAYYYSLEEVPEILNAIVAQLGAGPVLQNSSFDLPVWGSFTLRGVDTTWVKGLMAGALDFYKVRDIPAFQIVPDPAHWTIDVPDLSRPWSATAAPAWRWLHEEWKYPVPLKSVGITNLAVLRGEPVTEVMRWEEDEWELFAGPGPDVPKNELRVVPLGTILASDQSLDPVVSLSTGTGLRRDDGVSEWHTWGNRTGQDSATDNEEADG